MLQDPAEGQPGRLEAPDATGPGGGRGQIFQHGERVAARQLDQGPQRRRADTGTEPPGEVGALGDRQPAEPQHLQAQLRRRRAGFVADGEDHDDAFGRQAVRGEQQDLPRFRIDPLKVVDQNGHRVFGPDAGQHPQRRGARPQLAPSSGSARRSAGKSQAPLEGMPLSRRQLRELLTQREQYVRQGGKREAGLGFHPANPEDTPADPVGRYPSDIR